MTDRPDSLDLALIGNGTVAALVDDRGRHVWACFPHLAGDPAFCSLLGPTLGDTGFTDVLLDGMVRSSQRYLSNTPILVTELHDGDGNAIEIVDFAPRFRRWDRMYHPVMFVRTIRPLSGTPRVTIRCRPLREWGAREPDRTSGSSHLRWLLTDHTLRLTTDVKVPFIEHELPFVLDRKISMVLGPDETLTTSAAAFVHDVYDRTLDYWRSWSRSLSIPFEWQDAVIRAAITLKLCQYEGTGAIVAAVTTSVPESPGTGRNWDYRYCWLRDAAYVVRALNRLGATQTMEDYLSYIYTLASGSQDLQPVYGVHFEQHLDEQEIESLRGYRGNGPVRNGNLAYQQRQNDVYGSVVLASTHLFFDQRLAATGDETMFRQLERAGEQAFLLYDQPDAGLWEFRGREGVHTYSSVMCWAACDRLSRVAARMGEHDRGLMWAERAAQMRDRILAEAYDEQRSAFTETWGGERLDASLLVLADLGFVDAMDPRFLGTLAAVEQHLRRGDYVFRYVAEDDFGVPDSAFNLCTFWYIDALAAVGRLDEARDLFENMLSRRNHLGLLSEDLDPVTGELWGNFPQTYSMVGIIQSAMRLSRPWEDTT